VGAGGAREAIRNRPGEAGKGGETMYAALEPQWDVGGKLYNPQEYNPAIEQIVSILSECNVPFVVAKEIMREVERTAEGLAIVKVVDE